MGWVKKPIKTTREVFDSITKNLVWIGTPRGNSTPYEFFTDYIRDNYDVTLKQCDIICTMLKKHYCITHFYYGE